MNPPNTTNFQTPLDVGSPNEAIELSNETVHFASGGAWHVGNGKARLCFLPRPSLRVDAHFKLVQLSLSSDEDEQMGLPDRGIEVPGFSRHRKSHIGSSGSALDVDWIVSPEPLTVIGDNSAIIERVVFHLVNFPEFMSPHTSTESTDKTSHRINHLFLSFDEFSIHLRSIPSTSDNTKVLRELGGYAITHIGEISRQDHAPISISDADRILIGLHHFFSFCSGSWATPIIPIGLDSKNNRLWERWNSPKGESFIHSQSWFSRMHGTHLESLFPGFMSLWKDDPWQDAIREAVKPPFFEPFSMRESS